MARIRNVLLCLLGDRSRQGSKRRKPSQLLDVPHNRHGCATERIDLRNDVLGLRSVAAVGHNDVATAADRGRCGVVAKAMVGARHKCDLVYVLLIIVSG